MEGIYLKRGKGRYLGSFFCLLVLVLAGYSLFRSEWLREKIGVVRASKDNALLLSANQPSARGAYRIDSAVAYNLTFEIAKDQSEIKSKPETGKPEDKYPVFELLRTKFSNFSKQVTANLLRYQRVSFSDNYRVSSEELLEAARVKDAPWAWDLSLVDIQSRLELLPWVEKTQVEMWFYPLRLEILVREAQPWLVAEYEGQSWLVSTAGALVQTLDSISDHNLIFKAAELPRLDGLDAQPRVKTYLSSADARFVYAIKSLRFLEVSSEFPFKIERVTLLPQGAIAIEPLEFDQFPRVILFAGSLEEAAAAIAELRLVLEDTNRRGEKISEVDLRYERKAVVR